ncbi:MAG: LytR/AlgR family response regulator transcription factor [Flavobacteriaceae bacterium]
MNVIIIEDEKPAARRLKRLLEKQNIAVNIMLHSVVEAKQWFLTNEHPDVIFLDIQLSDGLSFEIFEEIDIKSAVIFTTAYDEYALEAFKLNSIDYLLKPIDEDDLVAAINKYKSFQPQEKSTVVSLADVKKLLTQDVEKTYKNRFTIKVGQHLKMISVADIECIYSADRATYIHTTEGRDYLLDSTLEQLEDQLQPELFFRISRKFLININAVKDIIAYTNSRLKIQLHKFKAQELIVSRERVKDFKTWLN